MWPDELSEELTSGGRELVGDLLIVRGYLHRAVAIENWGIAGGDRFLETWQWALLEQRLEWNGFKRIALNAKEREVLDRALSRWDV